MSQELRQVMDTDDFLAHYGKKGMRWGVRNVYAAKVTRLTDKHDRVASGKGSLSDKARVYGNLGAADIAAGRGLKGGAAVKSARQKEHLARVMAGEKTALDGLQMYGRLSAFDLVAATRKKK